MVNAVERFNRWPMGKIDQTHMWQAGAASAGAASPAAGVPVTGERRHQLQQGIPIPPPSPHPPALRACPPSLVCPQVGQKVRAVRKESEIPLNPFTAGMWE